MKVLSTARPACEASERTRRTRDAPTCGPSLRGMVERVTVDVVVVGAGLAGLSAARGRSSRRGKTVVVLEARDRVGGRVHGRTLSDGETVVEVGGQWIGPGQHRMVRLVERARARDVPDLQRGREPPALRDDAGALPGRDPADQPADPRRHGAGADPLRPARAPGAARGAVDRRRRPRRWDAQTFETWIVRNAAHRRRPAALLRLYSEAVFAAEPEDFSLLHALFYTHSGGGVDALGGSAATARSRTATSAARSSCRSRMAEELGADVVRLARRCGGSSSAATSSPCSPTACSSPPGTRSSRSRRRSPVGSTTTRRCPATATS